MHQFTDSDYWKGIILYGLNQATYKIVLGKCLLELTQLNKEAIEWSELSKSFFDNYVLRFQNDHLPQQSNPSRLTKVEGIYARYKKGLLSYDAAVDQIGLEAFNDVIPRFQTIGLDKNIAADKFYHFAAGKKLYLHDSVFRLAESDGPALRSEIEARWGLLEGAFTISISDWKLSNDVRDTYILNGYKRKNITHNIPFLAGYQGNVCFYCGDGLLDDIHVDHVLPRQVVHHDEIWNLVLSHSLCNMHKDDALVSKHYIEKLIHRNENIMGSNHPWKKKIAEQLGSTREKRIASTLKQYDNVKIALHNRYWENNPNYNRETDPFFKRLLTVLNN